MLMNSGYSTFNQHENKVCKMIADIHMKERTTLSSFSDNTCQVTFSRLRITISV